MYLVGIILFGFGWTVFSVTQFITFTSQQSWGGPREEPCLWTWLYSPCQGLSLLYCPECGRPGRGPRGTSALCQVGQTMGVVAQSVNGSWQLAATEVLGGLTGRGQKQETFELIGTCPGIHVKTKWQVRTWCDLKVIDHWAKSRQEERKHSKSIIRQTEDFYF